MPELPEAETIAADLRRRLPGRRVSGTAVRFPDVLGPGLAPGSLAHAVTGRSISEVARRGKNIVLVLDDETRILVNLGMTGRLVMSDAPAAAELSHVAVRLDLDRGALLYDDTRRFGRIEVLGPDAWKARDRNLGAEPLARSFTAKKLHRLTSTSRSPIRNWLLDQNRVAGIGNIYASEALFRARIHPARPANSLSEDEAARLHRALRAVLHDAIRARGTTFSDYRDGSGEEGGFEPQLRAYGRAGERCVRCRSGEIQRIVLSNRAAFFCPKCQGDTAS